MAYNLADFNFNHQKNWINTAQHHSRKTSKEGKAFMIGVFWVIIVGLIFCALTA